LSQTLLEARGPGACGLLIDVLTTNKVKAKIDIGSILKRNGYDFHFFTVVTCACTVYCLLYVPSPDLYPMPTPSGFPENNRPPPRGREVQEPKIPFTLFSSSHHFQKFQGIIRSLR
jgi:hypothetical protein